MNTMVLSPIQQNNDYVTKLEFEDFQVGLDESLFLIDRRFDEAKQFTKDAFNGLEKYVDIRFDVIDEKLENMDRNFACTEEKTDKRFDSIDQKFTSMNKKIDDLGDRLGEKINTITDLLTKKA